MMKIGNAILFSVTLLGLTACGSPKLEVSARSSEADPAFATPDAQSPLALSPEELRQMGESAGGLEPQVGNSTLSIGSALKGLISITRSLAFAVGTIGEGLVRTQVRSGSTFVHWGHGEVPEGAKAFGGSLLYRGQTYASYYSHARNHEAECIAEGDSGQGWKSHFASVIYPTITDNAIYLPDVVPERKLVKCSVVYVPSNTVTMKGTDACPAEWSKMYSGYMLSGHYSHPGGPPSSMCVDTNFDASSGLAAGGNYSLVYGMHLGDTSHELPNQKVYRFLKCAVCAKN